MERGTVTLPKLSSLDDWVDGIRHRSDAAFRAVHQSIANDLASFAIDFLHDRKAAEDAVQQAFLELVTAADTIEGDGRSLRAWLYRSVRFTCLDELRRRKRKPVDLGADELDHPPIHVDPLEHQLTPELETALNQLSDRQRSLVLLRHVVELSGEEIADVMNMARAAVYAALSRAETKLRSLLDRTSTPTGGAR
jgi:RNA polymerase sigma-70 factor (ECF subfamily)